MKILKKILIVLLGLIVLVLIVGFLLPRHVTVERSLFMKAHPGLAYNQVIILKNWDNWSPWLKMDSAMKRTYSGPSMGVGASYAWTSEQKMVGSGSMKVVKDSPYDTIGFIMELEQGSKPASNFYFKRENEGVTVRWAVEMDMGFNPAGRYFGLLMDKMMGPIFADGLSEMKKVVESNPNALMAVAESDFPGTSYLYIREMLTQENIGEKMGIFYPEISNYTVAKGGKVSGPPFSMSYTWEGTEWDVACGMPVDKPIPGEGRIKEGTIAAGKVVTCDYYGAYEGTGLPHKVVNDWLAAKKLKCSGQPWESYLADPMTEPNPEKWLTRVYYPVE